MLEISNSNCDDDVDDDEAVVDEDKADEFHSEVGLLVPRLLFFGLAFKFTRLRPANCMLSRWGRALCFST